MAMSFKTASRAELPDYIGAAKAQAAQEQQQRNAEELRKQGNMNAAAGIYKAVPEEYRDQAWDWGKEQLFGAGTEAAAGEMATAAATELGGAGANAAIMNAVNPAATQLVGQGMGALAPAAATGAGVGGAGLGAAMASNPIGWMTLAGLAANSLF